VIVAAAGKGTRFGGPVPKTVTPGRCGVPLVVRVLAAVWALDPRPTVVVNAVTGPAVEQAAREAGFDIAATGEAGIDRLLGSIESDLRLLHLCGEERRAAEQARQEITEIPVYRSKPLADPDLSGAAGSVALIHSPRAGQRFAELASDRKSIAVAAISRAAADAVGDGWDRIEVAEAPNDDALLALAATLCNKPDPE
jgi:uroporphyrinogen-III synthase